jgi:hypothetical protein
VANEDEHHAREDPATEAARRNREQTNPSRERGAMKSIRALVVGWLFLNGLSIAGAVPREIGRPDTLVLRSRSSFSLQEFSVDLGRKGVVELRTCAARDSFGGCKVPWRTNQRRLVPEELRTLTRLALEAKLFSGRSNGAHMDFAFRWLEVRSRNDIAMLVTTLNDSFSESGPRKDLLTRLYALEKELTVSEEP